MNLQPTIQYSPEKKLMGYRLVMSLEVNTTFQLWSSFMPCRKMIKNASNDDLISIQVYPRNFRPGDVHQRIASFFD